LVIERGRMTEGVTGGIGTGTIGVHHAGGAPPERSRENTKINGMGRGRRRTGGGLGEQLTSTRPSPCARGLPPER